MRTSRNERDSDTVAAIERRCILSGVNGDRHDLIRLALGPDGVVAPDVRAKAPGRGAWIGVTRAVLDAANAKGKLKAALARTLKAAAIGVPADLGARIEAALARDALDRLGLEARSGMLLTGSERIETAARSGMVAMLLHAADAGVDGCRKLDQAWRIGSDAEGSGTRGLVLTADRSILSAALGRDNVVHIAVSDQGAAARIGRALSRWHKFIEGQGGAIACETASQGSSRLAMAMPDSEGHKVYE